MLCKLRAAMVSGEEGFTLIEILLVMIIIGILSAIAIPAFLNQSRKAVDSGGKAMAHTTQVAMETFALDNKGSYATATPAKMKAIDSSILTAPGAPPRPYASAASGTATTFTLTITTPTGNTFRIIKAATGAVTYTCTVPAGQNRGGCPSSGKWG
jgi:type IV pilus assembly protein PilA